MIVEQTRFPCGAMKQWAWLTRWTLKTYRAGVHIIVMDLKPDYLLFNQDTWLETEELCYPHVKLVKIN